MGHGGGQISKDCLTGPCGVLIKYEKGDETSMAAAEGIDMLGCPNSLNAFAKATLDCTSIGTPLTCYANLASHHCVSYLQSLLRRPITIRTGLLPSLTAAGQYNKRMYVNG